MIFLGELGAVAVERPEVLACGLLSRVMGVASPSRTFSHADGSLELEAALPVGSQSAPPSTHVLHVEGFPWVFVEPVGDLLGRATFVTEDDVFLQQLDPCLQARNFVMSNFRERLMTRRTGLWARSILRMRFIRCAFWDGCSRFFALSAVLASEVGYAGKTINQRRLDPDSLIYPVPTTLPIGFSWAMVICQDFTDHCTLAESEDSALFVFRDHSTPALLGCKHGIGSLGFRWSYVDNFWVLARGGNCTNVHLARLIAGVNKACGSADLLGYEVSPANAQT